MKKIIFILGTSGLIHLFASSPSNNPPAAEYNFNNQPTTVSSNYQTSDIQIQQAKKSENIKIPDNNTQNDYQKQVKKGNKPDYNNYFPTAKDEDNNSNSPLVGNDGIPTKDINSSVVAYHNFGKVSIGVRKDANGRLYYVNPETNKTININKSKSTDKNNPYKKALLDYYKELNKLDSLKEKIKEAKNKGNNVDDLEKQLKDEQKIVNKKLAKAKTEKYKYIEKIGANAATILNSNKVQLNQAVGTGRSFANDQVNNQPFQDANLSNSENNFTKSIVENSRKMHDFYKDTYTTNIEKIGRRSPVIKDKNVTTLINAYKAFDNIQEIVKNRLGSNQIRCYASRELLPSYYCPLPGKDADTYPDYRHIKTLDDLAKTVATDPAEAKRTCDGLCFEKHSCISYHVLDNTTIKAKQSEYKISPLNDNAYPIKITIPVNAKMAITNFSFNLLASVNKNKYKPSEHNNTSFVDYYKNLPTPIKVKVDIYAYFKNKPAVPIVKDFTIKLQDGLIVRPSIFANMAMDGLVFYIYKPYFYNDQFKEYNSNFARKVLYDYLKNIKISNIQGKYASKDWWYCPFRQIVKDQTECKKPILELKKAHSVIRICTDAAHKAGPEITTGAFYSNESCLNSCIENKNCKVTYRHYKYITNLLGDADGIYKVKVGCIDTPNNKNCTEKICKTLFEDSKYRPNQESVVQGDDTKVLTIRNKLLTGIPRPRVNIASELNANLKSNERKNIFIEEEKDAAFNDMIQNQNINVINTKIGTESPRQQAYKSIKFNSNHTQLNIKIKPESFKFDDNQNYYLYSVLKVESIYRPEYGVFLLGADSAPEDGKISGESGQFKQASYFVDATKHPIVLKDIMYAIKDPKSKEGWKVFREEYLNQIRIKKIMKKCYDLQGKESIVDYNPKQTFNACTADDVVTLSGEAPKQPKGCCYLTTQTRWVDYTGSHINRNAFYNAQTDTFNSFSANSQLAPYYKELKFTSNEPIYEFKILDNLSATPHEISGLLFHSQKPLNKGESFARVFKGQWNTKFNALLGDIKLYNFYASHKLSYSEVLNNLTEKNKFYDMYNSGNLQTKIISDSTFDNNIKLYKLGSPKKLSIQADITPKQNEENKKVFKFIFLKDFVKSNNAILYNNHK